MKCPSNGGSPATLIFQERHATLNLYLDTEFNGHGGELISIALSGSDGSNFYAEAPMLNDYDPWVKVHVVPYLTGHLDDFDVLRKRLQEYLQSRDGCTIYADWPADFEHLMNLMCGPSYAESWMIDCELKLIKESDPVPAIPHNALSDAIALREWHEQKRDS